jgi:hypothetical protein
MKLDSHSMEFSDINLFCLQMSRVNDYIIECTNEGLNSKDFLLHQPKSLGISLVHCYSFLPFACQVKIRGIT